MNLYDIVTAEAALQAAVAATKWTKPKEATLDKFSANIVKAAKMLCSTYMAEQIADDVADAFKVHVETLGERDMAELLGSNKDEWDSGLDDRLEAIVEPYQNELSADWLATATIDSGVRSAEDVAKWCGSFGDEVYKSLTAGKTPAQVLAAVGIVAETITQWFEYGKANGTTAQAEVAAEAEEAGEIDTIVATIKNHVGGEIGDDDLTAALDDVLDDDDILAYGAAARIGISNDACDVLRMAKLGGGIDIASLFAAVKAEPVADAPKRTRKKAPENAPGSPAPVADAETIPTAVFVALKEHSSVEASSFCTELGVSRSSYTNYEKGKTQFTPTNEQRSAIVDRVWADFNGLREALLLLGEDPNVGG